MKKLLLIILCVLLLPVWASAEPAQAEIASFDAVYTLLSTGDAEVTVTVRVNFPKDATSFMLPLPAAATQIAAPGLKTSEIAEEDRLLLVVSKSEGFSSSDTLSVSYRLPQSIETWDGRQTLTLPLLFDNWNCEISSCSFTVQLPAPAEIDPSVLDADGERIRNFLTETVEEDKVILEGLGKNFTPEITILEMDFPDGYFTLPQSDSPENLPTVTQITSLDAACTVLEDSSCTTVLNAEYSFYGSEPFVQIPVPTDAYDISMAGMKFSKKKQPGCTLLTVENPAGFSGVQSFQVSYRLLTTASEVEGVQAFSLPLIFSQWQYSIRSFRLSLALPREFEGLPGFVSSYYNDQIDNYLDIQLSEGVISAASLQPLMEQESLTVNLSLPNDYFDLRFLQGRSSVLDTVLFWVLVALCILYWFFFLRIRIRRVTPTSDIPLNCNAGQIPYLLQTAEPSLGLMAASWGSWGYLSMVRVKKKKQYLVARMDMGNERSRCETALFSALFGGSGECRFDSGRFLTARQRSLPLTQEDWKSRLLRKKFSGKPLILKLLGLAAAAFAALLTFDKLVTPQSYRWFIIVPLALLATVCTPLLQQVAPLHFVRHPWKKRIAAYAVLLALLISGAAAGCFGTMLVNCLLQILIGLVLLPGGKRTAAGTELFYQLLGLRKALRQMPVTDIPLLLARDPQYFYRMLPYAEALGIGRRFAKKFAGLSLERCHWLDWKGQTPDGAEAFYDRFSLLLDEADTEKRKKLL